MRAAQCRRLIPLYATGDSEKIEACYARSRGLPRMNKPGEPGPKLDQIHLQCVTFATHTGGIMSRRLSTPPPSAGAGPFHKMCLLLLPRRIAMKMVMKLIAGLAVTAILATSADA